MSFGVDMKIEISSYHFIEDLCRMEPENIADFINDLGNELEILSNGEDMEEISSLLNESGRDLVFALYDAIDKKRNDVNADSHGFDEINWSMPNDD